MDRKYEIDRNGRRKLERRKMERQNEKMEQKANLLSDETTTTITLAAAVASSQKESKGKKTE